MEFVVSRVQPIDLQYHVHRKDNVIRTLISNLELKSFQSNVDGPGDPVVGET